MDKNCDLKEHQYGMILGVQSQRAGISKTTAFVTCSLYKLQLKCLKTALFAKKLGTDVQLLVSSD